MTFNRFAGLGSLHALRTLVFRSRTAWLRGFQGRERDVRDESASVCLGGAGRQCIEAVLPLATDEVRVDVRAPSRSAVAIVLEIRRDGGGAEPAAQGASIRTNPEARARIQAIVERRRALRRLARKIHERRRRRATEPSAGAIEVVSGHFEALTRGGSMATACIAHSALKVHGI